MIYSASQIAETLLESRGFQYSVLTNNQNVQEMPTFHPVTEESQDNNAAKQNQVGSVLI